MEKSQQISSNSFGVGDGTEIPSRKNAKDENIAATRGLCLLTEIDWVGLTIDDIPIKEICGLLPGFLRIEVLARYAQFSDTPTWQNINMSNTQQWDCTWHVLKNSAPDIIDAEAKAHRASGGNCVDLDLAWIDDQ
jgi:hypothetical protein